MGGKETKFPPPHSQRVGGEVLPPIVQGVGGEVFRLPPPKNGGEVLKNPYQEWGDSAAGENFEK